MFLCCQTIHSLLQVVDQDLAPACAGDEADGADRLGAAAPRPHELGVEAARRPRVLVTGATGLLGRQVMEALGDGVWEVRGLCRTRRSGGLVACDLLEDGAAAAQVEEFRPEVVLHLQAVPVEHQEVQINVLQ